MRDIDHVRESIHGSECDPEMNDGLNDTLTDFLSSRFLYFLPLDRSAMREPQVMTLFKPVIA